MALIPFFRQRDTCPPSVVKDCTGYADDARLWMELYRSNAPWCVSDRRSLNLPSLIAGEIARLVTVESEIIVGDSENSEFLDGAFESLRRRLRKSAELACAGGGLIFLPCLNGGRVNTAIFAADMIIPIRFGDDGEPISIAVVYRADTPHGVYFRVETHVLEGGGCIVTNRAVKSSLQGITPLYDDLSGEAVQLSDIPEWADIEPRTVFAGTDNLMLSYFALPNVSARSLNTGCSIYSRAVSLIKEADLQFRRLLWEFEGGELAIDVSEDLFRRTKAGLKLPAGRERLFRPNLIDSNVGDPMRTFSPTLRDESYIRGLDVILMRIEDVCGLSRGTVSSLTYSDRTATEIMDSKQRLYSTVTDIQKSLSEAIKAYAAAVVAFGHAHGLCSDAVPPIEIRFGDSIIEDGAAKRQADLEEVKAGVMTADEFRRKWQIG